MRRSIGWWLVAALAVFGVARPARAQTAPAFATVTLPSGYVLSGMDCSPLDPATWRFVVLYPDADGDGVGAAPRFVSCLGATLPAGASPFGWDVDDADPSRQWTGEDDDLLTLLR